MATDAKRRKTQTPLPSFPRKGFKKGTYCIGVEYDGLAQRVGFGAARRAAREYCDQVKAHLARVTGIVFPTTASRRLMVRASAGLMNGR